MAALPFYAAFKEMLAETFQIAEYTGIVGNPLISHVTAGTALIKANPSDAVVAIGGGAAMDVAKCIALMAYHPGDLLDYEDGKENGRSADQHCTFNRCGANHRGDQERSGSQCSRL